jgi:hypothetical protein
VLIKVPRGEALPALHERREYIAATVTAMAVHDAFPRRLPGR